MTRRVPYMRDDAIERDAEALLAQYAHARGVEIRLPIPIEDIVEKHLKLRVEFDDLHRLLDLPRSGLGVHPDIFGAIWLDSGRIVIDESLDPEERPAMEGAIVSPLRTNAVDIGVCIAVSSGPITTRRCSSRMFRSRP
jgi:hypothetical protein